MRSLCRALGVVGVLWLAAPVAAAADDPLLDAVIAGPWRPAEETARDRYRHPKQTLEFFGLAPGQTVVEIWPGRAGWYTKILAPYAARSGGTFTVAEFDADSDYARQTREGFREAILAHPETYGKVRTSGLSAESKGVAPDGSADLVVTFRNAHNWIAGGFADKAFADMYRALKPGGVLGVVDHRLPPGREQDEKVSTGYVHEAFVISLAQKAGFVLEARSEINANPKDTADHPFGVWTLPPSLRTAARGEAPDPGFDSSRYLAIGESDRFTLKFRKPAK